MEKRGQAAMEFLMTYGWAILAAIIVIGVLAIYFRPSSLASQSFVVTAPLYGVGSTISTSQVQIEIRNNGGEDINTTTASIDFTSPTGANCTAVSGTGALTAGDTQIITFSTCSSLTSGSTVSADVSVSYTRPDSSLVLQSTGSLTGKVA